MKHLLAILLFGTVLLSSLDVAAQSRRERRAIKRPERTSSAQAAYGTYPERQHWGPKKQKSKGKKNIRKRPAKGTRADAGRSYRRGGSGPKFFPTF